MDEIRCARCGFVLHEDDRGLYVVELTDNFVLHEDDRGLYVVELTDNVETGRIRRCGWPRGFHVREA